MWPKAKVKIRVDGAIKLDGVGVGEGHGIVTSGNLKQWLKWSMNMEERVNNQIAKDLLTSFQNHLLTAVFNDRRLCDFSRQGHGRPQSCALEEAISSEQLL
jgi:hypothetical protein